ncbi:ATP-binding protein [Methylocystis iwaonis]|uniref:ATP-binding protein n=1 Tax=Methylocystis iwaonis TaxID=2885079 RepID=UPI002E7AD03A|nr:ATP-binding protein [Methylocystis iwaonis]
MSTRGRHFFQRLTKDGRSVASAFTQPLPVRLLIATLAVAIATALRFAIQPILGEAVPYATYYLAVEASALLGGWIVGLLAMLASAFLAHLLFAPIASDRAQMGLALFLASCASLCLLTGVFRCIFKDKGSALAAVAPLAWQTEPRPRAGAIDAAQDAVLIMDGEGRILSANRAGAAMFAYPADEIIGATAQTLFDLPAGLKSPLIGRAPGLNMTERTAIKGRRKNGARFPAELTLEEMDFDGNRLFVAIVTDVTDRRNMEREVDAQHASRLDAIGALAAALAHEINQPLAASATYMRVARRLLQKSELDCSNVLAVLDKATAQTLRAGRIVLNLKDLVRREEPDKTLLSMHALISAAREAFLSDGAPAGFVIDLSCAAKNDRILADRAQLGQVFASLMHNANEAMQLNEIAQLLIATSNPDDKTIRVDVADRGCGLPDSSEEGCFDLFTTTKVRGMGVGLSISKSIIEAHDGRIWAMPNAGGGAVFSFTLPLQDSGLDS